jgi:hypothetical protein
MMDDVLLNQRSNLAGLTEMTVLRRTELMLQDLRRLWNPETAKSIFLLREGRLPAAGQPVRD